MRCLELRGRLARRSKLHQNRGRWGRRHPTIGHQAELAETKVRQRVWLRHQDTALRLRRTPAVPFCWVLGMRMDVRTAAPHAATQRHPRAGTRLSHRAMLLGRISQRGSLRHPRHGPLGQQHRRASVALFRQRTQQISRHFTAPAAFFLVSRHRHRAPTSPRPSTQLCRMMMTTLFLGGEP